MHMCVFTLLDIIWNLPNTKKEVSLYECWGRRLGMCPGRQRGESRKIFGNHGYIVLYTGTFVAHMFGTWYLKFLLGNHISVVSRFFMCDEIVQNIGRMIFRNTSVAFSLFQTLF